VPRRQCDQSIPSGLLFGIPGVRAAHPELGHLGQYGPGVPIEGTDQENAGNRAVASATQAFAIGGHDVARSIDLEPLPQSLLEGIGVEASVDEGQLAEAGRSVVVVASLGEAE
jgi:hypothetical protein